MTGKLKAIFLLGVMYGLGVVSGVAWHRYHTHHVPLGHTMFADKRLKRMKSQLNLTDAQEKSVGEIFQQAHERAVQVNEEVSWDLADIHHDTVRAIQNVLTPEQNAKFEKLHKQFHARHDHMPIDDLDESTDTARGNHP